MGLYDVVAAAQGGRCFYNLGRRLQIDEVRASRVAWHLMRALRPSFESWLSRPGGGYLLLESLGEDGFERVLHETAGFTDSRIRDRGYRLVSQWIASAPLDARELALAESASNLPRETLMRSLPWVAALMMGAVHRLADKPLRLTLERLRGKRFAEHVATPYLALLKELSTSDRQQRPVAAGGRLDSIVARLAGTRLSGQAVRA
ncbi:MAG: hypothetical protein R3D57_08785 [Hyphomicrobiaceae bacterium]